MNLNLIDTSENVIIDYLKAYSQFNHDVIQVEDRPIILRKDIEKLKNKVVILSGGGSGHEPAHAGFVGKGMLSAAVAGNIFTSPPSNTILEGIYQIGKDNNNGVLLIIKNYTGDRVNFNIAAERARKLGVSIEIITVGEDVALKTVNKACGRRGLAGVVLVQKIAGAMADKDFKLNEIKEFLLKILEPGVMGTIGISFNKEISSNSSQTFYELGLGIHGEAGVDQKKFQNTDILIKEMISHITTQGIGHIQLLKGQKLAILVNNLGSCTNLEIFVFIKTLINYIEKQYQVSVIRGYCGSFVTSLHMYGISITILKIINDSIIEYLDYPVSAPGWNNFVYKFPIAADCKLHRNAFFDLNQRAKIDESYSKCEEISENDFKLLQNAVKAACDALINKESYLNDIDSEIGDSDCGTTFKRGAIALKKFILDWSNENSVKTMSAFLSNLSFIIENNMGGSSGGLLSLFFESVSRIHNENSKLPWSDKLLESTYIISKIGGASEGDRTMLDVLFPLFKAWKLIEKDSMKNILAKLAEVAQKSSQSTLTMKPKAGRASYVKQSALFEKNPDAGAEAINIIVKAIKDNCFA